MRLKTLGTRYKNEELKIEAAEGRKKREEMIIRVEGRKNS
jgi:hypothetical protein